MYFRFTIKLKTSKNTYHGILKQSISTESFEVSITHHENGSSIPLHAHDLPYLCFSMAGFYEEKSNEKSIIEPGVVLYRNSGYEHANQFLEKDGLCLNIEMKHPEKMTGQHEFQLPTAEFQRKVTTDISKLLVSIDQDLPTDIIDIQCYESVFGHFQERQVNGDVKWIKKVIAYIHDNPTENISLEKLHQEFQLHANYIVRKFKEVTGYKLSEYLTKFRVEQSIQDLIQTQNNIGEIALDNGFYDQSHFNRSFKKHIGTSPMKFKKILQG